MIGFEQTGEVSAKYIIAISAKNERICFKILNNFLQILLLSLSRRNRKAVCCRKSLF
jgi:hypothetical protein